MINHKNKLKGESFQNINNKIDFYENIKYII